MTTGKLHINDDLITSLNFKGIPKIISPLFQHIVGVNYYTNIIFEFLV